MGASLSNIQLDKEYLLQAENTEINLVALSSVFALPSITIDDVDGSASSAAISVVEASQDTVTGTFRVQSEAGLAAVMINGIDISQARSDNVITFLTGYGTLRITGFEPSTGVFQYDYTDNGLAKDHSYGNYSVIDQFVITVMDQVGQSVSNTLDGHWLRSGPSRAPRCPSRPDSGSRRAPPRPTGRYWPARCL